MELQYKILHYCPDRNVGEFANVGILIYDKSQRKIQFDIIKRYHRLTEFFQTVKVKNLMKLLKSLNHRVDKLNVSKEFSFILSEEFDEIADYILKNDSSSLYFSKTYYYHSTNIDLTLLILTRLFLEKYDKENSHKTLTDEDVWRDYYKKIFHNKTYVELKKEIIKTKNDKISFSYTHVNGVMNIYEPVSFKLIEPQSIKQKVYRWSGILEELRTSNQKYKINFLSYIPEDIDSELLSLIKSKLQVSGTGDKKSTIYDQDELEKLEKDLEAEFKN